MALTDQSRDRPGTGKGDLPGQSRRSNCGVTNSHPPVGARRYRPLLRSPLRPIRPVIGAASSGYVMPPVRGVRP